MSSSTKHFLVLIGGLTAIFIAALVLTIQERYYAAALMVNAQLLWLLAFMAYTIFVHSRKRWPNRSFSERLYSIFTGRK